MIGSVSGISMETESGTEVDYARETIAVAKHFANPEIPVDFSIARERECG
jgi:hypothetical protein